MIRNYKTLALTLLVFGVLGAVTASGVLAKTFVSTKTPTAITGEKIGGEIEENSYGTKSSSFSTKCETTFGGTVVGLQVESITLHPTATNCTAGPLGRVFVDAEGCNYVLHATTSEYKNTSGIKEGEAGKLDYECEAGQALKLTGQGCAVSFGAQTGLLGVKYDNEGSTPTEDLKVTLKVDNISYTSTGGLCGLVGIKAAGSDAFLTGTLTLKGYEDKDAKGPVADQDAFTEGSQTGIKYE